MDNPTGRRIQNELTIAKNEPKEYRIEEVKSYHSKAKEKKINISFFLNIFIFDLIWLFNGIWTPNVSFNAEI